MSQSREWSVREAKAMQVCRICRQPISLVGAPARWMEEFDTTVYPVAVTLRYGAEFAHTACLPDGATAP